MTTEKKPLYISIDFEDIYNDYLKRLFGQTNYIVKEKFLHDSYIIIKNIINNNFKEKNLTFFTTGILGEKIPDLINQISKDGNEIGCHHYFQEDLDKTDLLTFERDLDKSQNLLRIASNSNVVGYRAPNFSINTNINTFLKIIFKYFDYDSSIFAKSKRKIRTEILKDNKKEFFIYTKKKYLLNIKPGGTYFRIFNSKVILNLLDNTFRDSFVPLIYLHPYDFLHSKEFWIELDKFKDLNIIKRYYSFLKQTQWHYLGNLSVEKKIKDLSKYYEHQGNMNKLLNND
tara:strand:+ start:3063 stop:3920 length:858 start_codon:yes stop_codon:yes gene_type:complete